jgi:hypothetical protein
LWVREKEKGGGRRGGMENLRYGLGWVGSSGKKGKEGERRAKGKVRRER